MKKIIFIPILVIISTLIFFQCKKDEIKAPLASSVADFDYAISNSSIAPATVTFTNKSIEAQSYSWDFGNGQTSAEASPQITYSEQGSYIVTLTITPKNSVYYNKLTKSVSLKIKAKPLRSLYFGDRAAANLGVVVIDTTTPVIQYISPTINSGRAQFLAIDYARSQIYVSDYSANAVKRFNLDGTGAAILLDGNNSSVGSPNGIALHNGLIYWGTSAGDIKKANLDGTNIQTIFSDATYLITGLAVDTVNNKLYFANDGYDSHGGVYQMNLDGSGKITIHEKIGADGVDGAGLAIDLVHNKIYYAHFADKGVYMNDLNGGNPVKVASYSNSKVLYGLAIDPYEGKLYIGDRAATNGQPTGKIIQCNLDGTSPKNWVTGVDPYGITIDIPR